MAASKVSVIDGSTDSVHSQLYLRSQKEISNLEHEYDFLLDAQINNFSDETYHCPNKPVCLDHYHVEYVSNNKSFGYTYVLTKVIANDVRGGDKSYVSLLFNLNFPVLTSVDLSCIISVIDSFNHERYTQSFTPPSYKSAFPRGLTEWLRIDNFLPRESLLIAADELLPNDCLNLRISLNFQMKFLGEALLRNNDLLLNSEPVRIFKTYPGENNLFLDSKLGEFLYKESDVFRAMFETDMLEKKQRSVILPSGHTSTLESIYELLMISKDLHIMPFERIYEMVILADYYNIAGVVEACTGILKIFLYAEDADIRKFAEENIENLSKFNRHGREILKRFIENSREIFARQELEPGTNTIYTDENGLQTKWTCTMQQNTNDPFFFLSRENIVPDESASLNFYQ